MVVEAPDTTTVNSWKNIRRGHKGYVTRKINEVQSLMEETIVNHRDVNKIAAIKETVESKLRVIAELDEKILSTTAEEKIEDEITVSSDHCEKVNLVLREIDIFLQAKDKETIKKYPTLPKIVIPSFQGDPRDFTRFWQLFDSCVHSNPKLVPIQKFAYLISLLEGDAKEAVRGIRQCEDGYPQLVDTLRKRFNRPELVRDIHMNSLLELKPVDNYNDHKQLRHLYDEIINSLESVGVLA